MPKTQELAAPAAAPPKMPAVSAVATPQNAVATMQPAPAMADPAALFQSFMAFMQQQQQQQQQQPQQIIQAPPATTFLTPEAKHGVTSPPSVTTRATPPSELAHEQGHGDEDEEGGEEQEHWGDEADVIVMPHGSKVAWFKYQSCTYTACMIISHHKISQVYRPEVLHTDWPYLAFCTPGPS